MAMIPPIMREPIGGFRSPKSPFAGNAWGQTSLPPNQAGGGQMIPTDAANGFRAPAPGTPPSNPFAGSAWGETSLPHGQLEPIEQIRQFLANARFHGQGEGLGHLPMQGGFPPHGGQMGEGVGGLKRHPLAGLIEALGSHGGSPLDIDGRRPNRAHAPAFRAQ